MTELSCSIRSSARPIRMKACAWVTRVALVCSRMAWSMTE
jgi:hypothetical protein